MIARIVNLAMLLFVTACGSKPTPPLPALLQGARGGGTTFVCGRKGTMSDPKFTAHSAEIVDRLSIAYPTGSSAKKLESDLRGQGFSISRCENDDYERMAIFNQTGGDGVINLSAFATVNWKSDAEGKVVWATGNTTYRGL